MSSHHQHHHSKSRHVVDSACMSMNSLAVIAPTQLFSTFTNVNTNSTCIIHPRVIDEEPEPELYKATVLMAKTLEYSFNLRFDPSDFVACDRKSPLLSPFSVRISNFSSVDETEEPGNGLRDDQAEDFITRFYEQLRMQSRT